MPSACTSGRATMTFDVDYALRDPADAVERDGRSRFQATIVRAWRWRSVGGLVLAVAAAVPLPPGLGRRQRLRPVRPQHAAAHPAVLPLLHPAAYGLTLDAFTTGVLGLGLHYSSYTAEVYRAGIQGVPRGQWEAATALNLSPRKTWRRVILPQAIPPVIPALGNYLSRCSRTRRCWPRSPCSSSSASRSTRRRQVRSGTSSRSRSSALIFLALSYPSALLVRGLERRFATA